MKLNKLILKRMKKNMMKRTKNMIKRMLIKKVITMRNIKMIK